MLDGGLLERRKITFVIDTNCIDSGRPMHPSHRKLLNIAELQKPINSNVTGEFVFKYKFYTSVLITYREYKQTGE